MALSDLSMRPVRVEYVMVWEPGSPVLWVSFTTYEGGGFSESVMFARRPSSRARKESVA